MRVFIAARGEVAIRVAKAVRELGWLPITVYTDEDRVSPHVSAGWLAVKVDSYTDPDELVEAAISAEADIVHPGYGFLSEKPEFAEKVLDAGIAWAGPSPKAMRLLGDKLEAKRLAEKVGVPTLQWCTANNPSQAARCVEKIGSPVVLKAPRAGGGRGLRIAYNPWEAAKLYRIVVREASNGFGDSVSSIVVERFIESPRHIEVQVVGDADGHVIHLYERECSIQRRRQKIIEEAPSPFAERVRGLREQLLDYALRLAEEVEYSSAGTVEFIVDASGNPFFIEANTRLQVEHGVTELVTGVDIVKSQLIVAAGRKLAYRQEDVKIRGWAIEARIYAEDPWRGFAISTGTIEAVRFPQNPWLRIDHSIVEGLRVSASFDTLLAKIIAYGWDRGEALERLSTALMDTVIAGIETNIDLLRVLVRKDWFINANFTTQTLEQNLAKLLEEAKQRRMLVSQIAERIGLLPQPHPRQHLLEAPLSHGWPWPPTWQ
ncbi:MAG: biotin carboxylase [Hyperthermus sp.]|nr:MAG: biotin carboxylase [Hyperthermus sp.]